MQSPSQHTYMYVVHDNQNDRAGTVVTPAAATPRGSKAANLLPCGVLKVHGFLPHLRQPKQGHMMCDKGV
mgnify:CR=1 FL=1|jgi:hypothetical protein